MTIEPQHFTFESMNDARRLFVGDDGKRTIDLDAGVYIVKLMLCATPFADGSQGIDFWAQCPDTSGIGDHFTQHVARIQLLQEKRGECRATFLPMLDFGHVQPKRQAAKDDVLATAQQVAVHYWRQRTKEYLMPKSDGTSGSGVEQSETSAPNMGIDLVPDRKKVLNQACIEWAERGYTPGFDMQQFLQEIAEKTTEFFSDREFERALADAGKRKLIRKIKNRWRPMTAKPPKPGT